jgi:hypothetical protein
MLFINTSGFCQKQIQTYLAIFWDKKSETHIWYDLYKLYFFKWWKTANFLILFYMFKGAFYP